MRPPSSNRTHQTAQLTPALGLAPNTDPGLAGETGVSREGATVYELDGLKVGGGIEGAGFTNGGGAERAGFVPCMRGAGLAPAACASSIVTNAPKKATRAARKNVASAIRSNLLKCIAISLEPI
jgi:hypothetical protein